MLLASRHRPGWTLLAGPHAAVFVFRSHRPLGLAVAARHAVVAAGALLDIFVLPLARPSGRIDWHGCSPSRNNDPRASPLRRRPGGLLSSAENRWRRCHERAVRQTHPERAA